MLIVLELYCERLVCNETSAKEVRPLRRQKVPVQSGKVIEKCRES